MRSIVLLETPRGFLDGGLDAAALAVPRRHGRGGGHPLGSEAFMDTLERALGRDVRPRPTGRPKSRTAADRKP